MESNEKAVLLMAYGTPGNINEVEDYFTDIRGGVKPDRNILQKIRRRYEAVGGRTPLLEITLRQKEALQKLLDKGKGGYKVYVGMKHWHPYIKNTLKEIEKDGIKNIIAIPLAPHYSTISTEGYKKTVYEGLKNLNRKINVEFKESWHTNPYFIECIVSQITEALKTTPQNTYIIYTAHSLPEKINLLNDPYYSQLMETSEIVSKKLSLNNWTFSFQSAGSTKEQWLKPDISDVLKGLKKEGIKNILICPIGFVSDHLEILYDIDIEAKKKAQEYGINLFRTQSRNTHPLFIKALETLIE